MFEVPRTFDGHITVLALPQRVIECNFNCSTAFIFLCDVCLKQITRWLENFISLPVSILWIIQLGIINVFFLKVKVAIDIYLIKVHCV